MHSYRRTGIKRRRRNSGDALQSPSAAKAKAQVRQALGGRLQAKLTVGAPSDIHEQEADRMAERVMSMPDSAVNPTPAGGQVQRMCAECREEVEEGKAQRLQRQPVEEEEEASLQPKLKEGVLQRQASEGEEEEEEMVQTKAASDATPTVSSTVADGIRGRRTGGEPLAPQARSFFEPRFGHGFSGVRVHRDAPDNALAESIGARAFTLGHHVFFGSGEYRPQSAEGKRLIAHELTHVLQQSAGESANRVQRDLAIQPPHEDTEARTLTPDQFNDALDYNRRRFEDPFTIKVIRDLVGIAPYPAVIDRAFVEAALHWQTWHGHNQDGKVGPVTTRTMVRELRAEGLRDLANQLRQDNFVQVRTVNGPTFNACTRADNVGFRWDVGFRTPLRNGFIVQRVDNLWNENPPPGRPAVRQTPRYWEAWRVDNAGNVTPNQGQINDMWTRITRPGSHGKWRMSGTLYTVLRLPAAAGFAAGGVPDAGILQSTVTHPSGLGLPEGWLPIDRDEGTRTIGGSWNCTNANAALNFHRRR